MKKKLEFVFLLFSSFIILSCTNLKNIFDFKNPVILSYSPENNSYNLSTNTEIYLLFSEKMSHKETEENIFLYKDNENIRINFNWQLFNDKEKLFIRPDKNLESGYTYKLIVSPDIRDINNNPFSDDFQIIFYTKGNYSIFRVTNTYPCNYYTGNTNLNFKIYIYFNNKLYRDNNYLDLISFSPDINGKFDFTNNILIFSPYDYYKKNIKYSVTVSKNIKDSNMNSTGEDFIFNFYTGVDEDAPYFIGIYTKDRELMSESLKYYSNYAEDFTIFTNIVFCFSKEMEQISTKNAITIYPEINGDYFWIETNKLELRLNVPMDYNVTYRFKISKDAEDLNSISLDKDYTFYFTTSNPSDTPLYVEYLSNSTGNILSNNQVNTIKFTNNILIFYIKFNPYKNSHVDIQTLLNDNLDIEMLSGISNSFSGNIYDVSYSDSLDTADVYITNIAAGNIYEFNINGKKDGIKDTAGTYMSQNYSYIIKIY